MTEGAKRAVWRARADDPRTLAGWAALDLGRHLRPVRRDLGIVAGIGALVLICSGYGMEAIGLMAFAFLLGFLRRPPRSVESLLTLPPVAPAYACTVDVLRDDVTIGTDRGVVTFLDGWLHFEGFHTAFSLSRADARGRKENLVQLRYGGVEFHPDEASPEFSGSLDRWYRFDRAAQGLSVLPPQRVHPSGVALAGAEFALALGRLAFCFAAIVLIEAIFGNGSWFVFVVLASPLDILHSARNLKTLARRHAAERLALPEGARAAFGERKA